MNYHPGPGKRWVKGQSGNPRGAPRKENSWKSILSNLLSFEDVTMPDGSKISRKRAIAMRMVQEALKGNINAANLICKYTESGKPTILSLSDSESSLTMGKVFVVRKETLESWNRRKKE
jgi:hypothetical protein